MNAGRTLATSESGMGSASFLGAEAESLGSEGVKASLLRSARVLPEVGADGRTDFVRARASAGVRVSD